MSIADRYREQVAPVALEAVGAHYVHGSFGNHPGVCNGQPTMDFRTRLATNHYRESPHSGIVIHTARTSSDIEAYCWGRPEHVDVRRLKDIPPAVLRDPVALEQFARSEPASQWKWPRTGNGLPGPLHMGESCIGKRHFDCIGFISWVIWRIFHTISIRDIPSCQRYARGQAHLNPELAPGQTPYQTGDILIFSVSHIAFALNERETVEANGENFGVIRGSALRRGVTEMLRPTDELLNNIWNVPRH